MGFFFYMAPLISLQYQGTLVKCNCQPADKGPLARGAATHIEHCVRSIYSPSGAASLATLVVPHSAMSVGEAWNHVTTSVWWKPGSGIAVHNVKCGVFHLFVCLFQNPILVIILAPFELGLGTCNPRFVACMVVESRNRSLGRRQIRERKRYLG